MMNTRTAFVESVFASVFERVEKFGVWLDRDEHGVRTQLVGKEISLPYFFLFLVKNGTMRVKYDLKEVVLGPEYMACVMPEHKLTVLEASDDLVFSRLTLSRDFYAEMRMFAFSYDAQKFHYQPLCVIENWQLKRISAFEELFSAILNRNGYDLPMQRKMLLSLTAVAYEFVNYYRREQDKMWGDNKYAALYNRFCALVAEHYKESREVKYYAALLSVSPKYFSQIFRSVAGISPTQWIEQFVVYRAKQLMDSHPNFTIQQVAYELGFCEPSSFYHYFRRVTGITAKEYRTQNVH